MNEPFINEYKTQKTKNIARVCNALQRNQPAGAGRGVKMCANVAALPPDTADLLVQRYIERPLTLDGYKFDLRVYVAVTCLDPLRVYVYEDGLVRSDPRSPPPLPLPLPPPLEHPSLNKPPHI